MHYSRMRTAHFSGCLSCSRAPSTMHTPATHAPCHASPSHACPPVMQAPYHTSLLPPTMHAPYHACPLPCMPPAMHVPSLGQINTCKNITFPQLLLRAVAMSEKSEITWNINSLRHSYVAIWVRMTLSAK